MRIRDSRRRDVEKLLLLPLFMKALVRAWMRPSNVSASFSRVYTSKAAPITGHVM